MKKFFVIIIALVIMAAVVLVAGYFCFYRLSTQPVTVQNIEFVGCLEKRGVDSLGRLVYRERPAEKIRN